ncbi:BTAD domain-containing putative transcriptional regulator [Deinococcus metalli]|nr:BTAD domain-containing putative transcriptional regulator [Deinococcus metalli]
MTPFEDALQAGQYATIIDGLLGQARTAREHALLGIALLRSGELPQAELPLQRSAILGDPEGTVEFGNLVRLLGRFDEARAHFEACLPTLLDPELQLRALRWWGAAAFAAGDTHEGLLKMERAWHGYVAYGDDALTARVTQSLAQMHAVLGNTPRARLLLTEAIRALPVAPDSAPRLSALKSLLDLQVKDGEVEAARGTLAGAKALLVLSPSPRLAAYLAFSEAELWRLSGAYAEYAAALETLLPVADALGDHHLRVWVTSRLAEHHSLRPQHGRAAELLHGLGLPVAQWSAHLWATDGVLRRRRGQDDQAAESLRTAARMFRDSGAIPELIRVLLHQGAAELRLGRHEDVAKALSEALTSMLTLRALHEVKPDLEELSELVKYAVLEPELSPYMEPLLDRLSHLAGTPRLPEDGAMRLRVTTLGRTLVTRDNEAIRFAYPNSPLLLAYLALEPDQTRAQLQLTLFPEKDAQSGAGYVRQCIWDLRDKLGPEAVTCAGPFRAPAYRLGPGMAVELDVEELLTAIAHHEVARALALYRGEFLPWVEHSDWVAQKRDEARLALTIELRREMEHARTRGDERRVVLYANQLLQADPLDVDALRERVRAATAAGAPAPELARYTAELGRVFH